MILKKHNSIFHFAPYKRIVTLLKRPEFDAAMTVSENHNSAQLYLTDSHIQYHNVVVTLKVSKLKINKVEDLKKLRVIAFQNASIYLGDTYKSTIESTRLDLNKAKDACRARLVRECEIYMDTWELVGEGNEE